MTLEEFVLERSYLPQNGTYTMTDHIMAMLMEVQGECAKLVIADDRSEVVVSNRLDSMVIQDRVDRIIVTDISDEI